MTYREFFYKLFPNGEIKDFCPDLVFGFAIKPDQEICNANDCTTCWDRAIPGGVKLPLASRNDRVSTSIKDSGNRRAFESGSVRDMQEGKGRCDLMPLRVVAHLMRADHLDIDRIMHFIWAFTVTNDTEQLYDAINDFLDQRGWDRHTMLLEVAKHFEEGAKKYGENNWQKGIPVKCYIDSAVRHYIKWRRGDKDEPHDRAFVWNLMCCIWEVDYHKERTENES